MAEKKEFIYNYEGDLFSDNNKLPEIAPSELINTENLFTQDKETLITRDDKEIERTYGVKFSGSHYDFLNNPITENFSKLNSDDIKKINLKMILEYKLGFKGKLENENLVDFLINEKGLSAEQAFFTDFAVNQIKPKPDISGMMSDYLLSGAINEDTNIFVKQQINAFKEDFSLIALQKYLKLFNNITNLDKIKELKGKYDLNDFFRNAVLQSKDGIKSNFISSCGQFLSQRIYREGMNLKIQLSQVSEGLNKEMISEITDKYEKECVNKAIDTLVEHSEKCIPRLRTPESQAIAINFKAQLIGLKESGAVNNLMDLYKESILNNSDKFDYVQTKFGWSSFAENQITLLKTNIMKRECDFSKELEGFNKYFNLSIRELTGVKDGEKEYIGVMKKIKNVAAVKKVYGYITINGKSEKEVFQNTVNKYKELVENGLIVEKEKPVNIKSTNNKALNKDLFIEKFPEIKETIKKQFKNVDFSSSPEKILLDNGVRGIEMGKTLKNKDNVLWNTIAVMASISDRMGVSMQEFTFDGSFGIALGSRGNGRSLAYFTGPQFLLAFTQKNEFESIVHEYSHALDYALAEYIHQDLIQNNPDKKYINVDCFATMTGVSDLYSTLNISDKNKDLFKKLIEFKEAIKHSEVYKNSQELDAGKIKKYWSSDVEIYARVSEVVAFNKINESNTPLIGCHKEYGATCYPQLNNESDKKLVDKFIELQKEIIPLYPEIAKEISKVVMGRDEVKKKREIEIEV